MMQAMMAKRAWWVVLALAWSLASGCGGDDAGSGVPDTDVDDAQPADTDTDDGTSPDDVEAPDGTDGGQDASPDVPDAFTPDDVAPPDGPDAPFFDPDVPIGGDTRPDVTPGEVLIFGIDPPSGPVDGGTFVVVFGDGFTPDAEVLIGGARLEGIDVVDAGTIVGFTPSGPAGVVDVKVVSARGQAVLPSAWRYNDRLSVASVRPERAPTRGGVPLTIEGTGFSAETRASIGGERIVDYRVVSSTRIEGVAPPGTAGPAEVRVTTGQASISIGDAFAYYLEPDVSAVSPAAGPASGGGTVTIEGVGFAPGASVIWDGRTVASTRIDDTRIELTLPAGAPGAIDVVVSVPANGTGRLAGGFIYVDPNLADGTLSGVTPARGDVAGDDLVTLAGAGLADVSEVRFGGAVATIEAATPWAVAVRTPAQASPGAVDVAVDSAAGTSTLASAFTYVATPRLLAVEPAVGSVNGNDDVLLRGEGLAAGARVRFGLLLASDVRVVAEGLRVRTPPSAAGRVDVSVEQDGQRTTIPRGFRYEGDVEIFGLVPSRGAIAGNTWVVVRGDNFGDDLQVFFGDLPGLDVTRLDASTLSVRTPPRAAGPVDVAVVSDGQRVTSPVRFTYYDPWRDIGGWWGAPVDGSVNVTVADSQTGARIPDAFVTLSLRANQRQFEGYTNAQGQVTLSGPGLVGRQTVSASAVDYSSVTVTNVDAENVIIFLEAVPEPSDGEPPTPPPPATIRGVLSGLDKITAPGPDEVLIGVIRTSTPVAGGRNPPGTGYAEVQYDGLSTTYPYEMASRLGDVAVVAICGAFNTRTGDFRPIVMGVRRGIAARSGEEYTVNIDCGEIPLNQTMSFKFLSSPVGSPGISRNLAVPFIDLGGEGGFDLLQTATGTQDTLTLTRLAPLTATALLGSSYFVLGEASGDQQLPFSVTFARTIRTTGGVVDLGPMLPPAELRQPAAPARQLVDRRFEWSLATSARPDFYYAFITDLAQEQTFWEAWVPGDERGFNLPFFPPSEATSDIPPGPLVLIVYSIDAYTFDYDQFSFNDFGQNNWRSFSVNGWVFTNPN